MSLSVHLFFLQFLSFPLILASLPLFSRFPTQKHMVYFKNRSNLGHLFFKVVVHQYFWNNAKRNWQLLLSPFQLEVNSVFRNEYDQKTTGYHQVLSTNPNNVWLLTHLLVFKCFTKRCIRSYVFYLYFYMALLFLYNASY